MLRFSTFLHVVHLTQKLMGEFSTNKLINCVFPILYLISLISKIRWIQLNQSSITEGNWKLFCICHTQLALWYNGDCEFKYRNFCFWKKRPSRISLNFNCKIGKTQILEQPVVHILQKSIL